MSLAFAALHSQAAHFVARIANWRPPLYIAPAIFRGRSDTVLNIE